MCGLPSYIHNYYHYNNDPLRVVQFHTTNWAIQLFKDKNPVQILIRISTPKNSTTLKLRDPSGLKYAGFKIWWNIGGNAENIRKVSRIIQKAAGKENSLR
jgi:hypothetical protein